MHSARSAARTRAHGLAGGALFALGVVVVALGTRLVVAADPPTVAGAAVLVLAGAAATPALSTGYRLWIGRAGAALTAVVAAWTVVPVWAVHRLSATAGVETAVLGPDAGTLVAVTLPLWAAVALGLAGVAAADRRDPSRTVASAAGVRPAVWRFAWPPDAGGLAVVLAVAAAAGLVTRGGLAVFAASVEGPGGAALSAALPGWSGAALAAVALAVVATGLGRWYVAARIDRVDDALRDRLLPTADVGDAPGDDAESDVGNTGRGPVDAEVGDGSDGDEDDESPERTSHTLVGTTGDRVLPGPDRWLVATRVAVGPESARIVELARVDRATLRPVAGGGSGGAETGSGRGTGPDATPTGTTGRFATVDRDRVAFVDHVDGALVVETDGDRHVVPAGDRPADLIATLETGPSGELAPSVESPGATAGGGSGTGNVGAPGTTAADRVRQWSAATRRELLASWGGLLGGVVLGLAPAAVTLPSLPDLPSSDGGTLVPQVRITFDYEVQQVGASELTIQHDGGDRIDADNTGVPRDCSAPALSIVVDGDHRACWQAPIAAGDDRTITPERGTEVRVVWTHPSKDESQVFAEFLVPDR